MSTNSQWSQSASNGLSNFHLESQSAFWGSVSQSDLTVDSEITDLRQVFLDFQPPFNAPLQKQFHPFRALKVSLFLTLEYQNTRFRNNEPFYIYLRSNLNLLYQESESPNVMKSMKDQIMLCNDNFVEKGTNLQISKILCFTRNYSIWSSGWKRVQR